MPENKSKPSKQSNAKRVQETGKKVLAAAIAIFGYAITNSAIYFLNNEYAFDYEINYWRGNSTNFSPKNNDQLFEMSFSDYEHILAFAIAVVLFACQGISGFRNYFNLILERLNAGVPENNDKEEQSPTVMEEGIEGTNGSINSSSDEKQEENNPAGMASKILKFIYLVADILGTHSKVLGNMATLIQFLDNNTPRWVPNVAASGQAIFADLANMAILGRDYNKRVYLSSVWSFVENILITVPITFGLAAIFPEQKILIGLAVWATGMFAQTKSVAASEYSIAMAIIRKLCCSPNDKKTTGSNCYSFWGNTDSQEGKRPDKREYQKIQETKETPKEEQAEQKTNYSCC